MKNLENHLSKLIKDEASSLSQAIVAAGNIIDEMANKKRYIKING
jgi:hypothetical protein